MKTLKPLPLWFLSQKLSLWLHTAVVCAVFLVEEEKKTDPSVSSVGQICFSSNKSNNRKTLFHKDEVSVLYARLMKDKKTAGNWWNHWFTRSNLLLIQHHKTWIWHELQWHLTVSVVRQGLNLQVVTEGLHHRNTESQSARLWADMMTEQFLFN